MWNYVTRRWEQIWRRVNYRTERRLREFEVEARHQADLYGPLNRHSLGIRTIEIHRIVGTVGRALEFDAEFQPCRDDAYARNRFHHVLKAMRRGAAVPPIEVYKLRRDYYVLDGHHRVGAARKLGMREIEAEVTVFIPSGDPDEVRLYRERQAFERATGLMVIGAARPGTYRRLLTEVHAYRRRLAEEANAAVDLPLAANKWYAREFLPAFAAIRSGDLRRWFPDLRSADMLACLWEEQRTTVARRSEHATPLVAQANAVGS